MAEHLRMGVVDAEERNSGAQKSLGQTAKHHDQSGKGVGATDGRGPPWKADTEQPPIQLNASTPHEFDLAPVRSEDVRTAG